MARTQPAAGNRRPALADVAARARVAAAPDPAHPGDSAPRAYPNRLIRHAAVPPAPPRGHGRGRRTQPDYAPVVAD